MRWNLCFHFQLHFKSNFRVIRNNWLRNNITNARWIMFRSVVYDVIRRSWLILQNNDKLVALAAYQRSKFREISIKFSFISKLLNTYTAVHWELRSYEMIFEIFQKGFSRARSMMAPANYKQTWFRCAKLRFENSFENKRWVFGDRLFWWCDFWTTHNITEPNDQKNLPVVFP